MEDSAAAGGTAAATAPLSLVSRAKTALHSAAAKAEKVITDIKADLKNDREDEGASQKGLKGSTEQVGADETPDNPPEEVSERQSSSEEAGSNTSSKLSFPPASVVKQLAAAVESGKNFRSINDLLASVGDRSPIREKLSFSVVKSLVLREKEHKSGTQLFGHEELQTLIRALFESEEQITQLKNGCGSAYPPMINMTKDIRGAPPECFTVRLAEIIGSFKSLQKMAYFWFCVFVELRRLWSEGQPIPLMPVDASPDLNSCLLHQQLQVINCCVARKHRRNAAIDSLNSILKESSQESNGSFDSPERISQDHMLYTRINSGDNVLRLGALHPSQDLTMLETGEAIYSPVTQEGPVLTEELIKETEEFVLRTGSVGAGCSRLLSDMQAFKAANPGCVLEDFIRWHSPPDWTEMELDAQVSDLADGEGSSRRGRLSKRMQKEGNLWLELWESAKALPVVNQTPLFDEDLAVESILTALEDIPPSELFEQLFASLLCSGLLIAEAAVHQDSSLSKLFFECKDYVIATYQKGMSNEIIAGICKVYETLEAIALHPEEVIMSIEQAEEISSEQPKNRFKKISLNFVSTDRLTLRRKTSKDEKQTDKDEKKPDEKHSRVFSNLFDRKSSIFSRRNSKSNILQSCEPNSLDESEWTIV